MIGKTNATVIIGGEAPTTGDYLVRYIDVDGTVLKEQWVDSGEDATPPTDPNYDSSYLTFSAWSKSSTNITNHKDIGALYTTLNNKSYAFITLTTASGLSPILYFYKSDGSTLTIDWGDSTQSTFTNSGNFNTGAHTYASVGNYVISMWISSGSGTYMFGSGAASTCFLALYETVLTKLYIGSNVTSINTYAFSSNLSLEVISMPSTFTTLANNAFQYCYKLKGLILNNNITNIPTYLARYCYSLINIVLPTAISNFGQYAFQYCRLLKYVIIPTVSNYTVGAYAFQYCYSLHTIILNSSIWYLSTSALGYCSAFTELVFEYLKSMQGSYNQMSALTAIDFSTNTSEIGAFQDCVSLTKVICRATTPPILGSNAFSTQVANSTFKIYVPDAQVATYKAAANWSTYANYIYPLSSL